MTVAPADRLYFKPNSDAQRRVLLSTAPELLYSGRYGSSKSRTATEKADLRCRKHAGARVVLARKRRVDLMLTTVPILLQQTISPNHMAWGWKRGGDGGSTLHYMNGSTILCVGLDNPGKLKSGEFDMILVDQAEELDRDEWESAAGRLRHTPAPYVAPDGRVEVAYRQIAGFCNPDGPGHWMFSRFAPQRGSHLQTTQHDTRLPNGVVVPKGTVMRETILAAALDNYDNLPPDYLFRLQQFTGVWHDRYVLGKWTAFEGLVYPMWDAEKYIVSAPDSWATWGGYPPPDWSRWRGIDFGYNAPFVCITAAEEPGTGRTFVYRQRYLSGVTVPEHAKAIREADERERDAIISFGVSHHGWKLDDARKKLPYAPPSLQGSWADHDAGDVALLSEANVESSPAIKDAGSVRAGIQMVAQEIACSRLLIVRDGLDEVDTRRQYEDEPTRLEDELMRYSWKKPASGPAERDEPVKQNDHACDALRYMIHGRMFSTVHVSE